MKFESSKNRWSESFSHVYPIATLRGQTVHWIGAQFCVCMFLDSIDKTFKHVPKCQWIPLTKLPSIPRTNTCNVNFVGTFVVPRIPQQANIASCSGFRNCKWIPQNASGIRKCEWNPQNLSAEFKGKDLTIVRGIHKQISKHLLTKSVDVSF